MVGFEETSTNSKQCILYNPATLHEFKVPEIKVLNPGSQFGELAPKLDSTYIPHRLSTSVFSVACGESVLVCVNVWSRRSEVKRSEDFCWN